MHRLEEKIKHIYNNHHKVHSHNMDTAQRKCVGYEHNYSLTWINFKTSIDK